jgi:NAD(P)-dependent dehydrogenase (short-subunit alcohol dehydrogenase family)
MKLQSKVIVITGATRGIGRAVAEACAREGAKVAICSRDGQAVKGAVDALAGQGLSVSGIPADVSAPGDLENLLQHAIDTWGGVDVWVNNAGLSSGSRYLHELAAGEIAEIVNVNLTGVLLACRLVIPYFVARGGGVLINLTGKGGRGDASPYTTTYAATKAAVTSLTRSLAKEYGDHPISIHAVVPGMVATDLLTKAEFSPELAHQAEALPYALEAFGVPIDEVAREFVAVIAQEPGKITGKVYSFLGGWRLARGIALMAYYGATGRLRGAR